jgi:hypothetical protein
MEIAPSTSGSAPTVVSVTSSDVPKLKSSVPMMTAAAEGLDLEAAGARTSTRPAVEELREL